MGRRSRSPPSRKSSRRRSNSRSPSSRSRRDRSRDRDRSRERRRNRSRDRSRDRDSERSGSNSKNGIDAKRRMREGLDAARSSTATATDVKSNAVDIKYEELDLSEQASRACQIDHIDEGGFQPAQFKSTAGGAGGRVYGHKNKKQETKADRVESAQSEHEKAMFGPAGRGEQVKKEEKEEMIPMPSMTALPKQAVSLLHPTFCADPEERQKKWLESWRDQRRALGAAI